MSSETNRLNEKARKLRLTCSEVMDQESVEITINDYLEDAQLFSITIHDKHYDLEVYINESELEDKWGLVLNTWDWAHAILN